MLKTIKTTKQMRLDELIKYVWDNDNLFKGEGQICFEVDGQKDQGFVCFENNMGASFSTSRYIELDETFTVEVEEPITDVTLLEKAVYVHKNETLVKDFNTSIDEILIGKHEGSVSKIYALVNGKLELVWERDEE